MAVTSFPQGLSSFGFPLIGSGPVVGLNNVWFVSSGAAGAADAHGYGADNKRPFKSISYALGIAGVDDIIFVAANHAETVVAAAAWANAAIGVRIIGISWGSRRPTITFSTSTAAQITITAANVSFENLRFDLTGIASLVAGFAISGADFQALNCSVVMSNSTNCAVKGFLLSGNAPKFVDLDINANGSTTGAASAIEAAGPFSALKILGNSRIFGNFSAGPIVSASTNIMTNILIDGLCLYQANGTAKVVVTLTTSDTGIIRNCTFIGTTWSSAANAIGGATNVALRWTQNFGFDDGAGAVSGVLVPAVGTIS